MLRLHIHVQCVRQCRLNLLSTCRIQLETWAMSVMLVICIVAMVATIVAGEQNDNESCSRSRAWRQGQIL
jgi:hypothetical protein